MGFGIQQKRVACITSGGPTQDITITDIGIPKGAVFILDRCTNQGVDAAHHMVCIGFTDGSNHKCILYSAEESTGVSNTWSKAMSNVPIVTVAAATGTTDGQASFVQWITDGVQITWDDLPPAAYFLTVIFFYGDILVEVGEILGTEGGSISLGFKPDIMIGAGQSVASFGTGTASTANGAFSIGMLAGGKQCCLGWYSTDGVVPPTGSPEYSIIEQDFFMDDIFSGTGYAVLTPTADGISINAGSLACAFIAISLKGQARTDIIYFDSPTSTGSHTVPVGFKPYFVFEFQTAFADYNSINNSDGSDWGLGIISIDTEAHCYMGRTNMAGAGTITAKSRCGSETADHSCQYRNFDSSITFTASAVTFNSTDYTRSFSVATAGGSPRKFAALVVSERIFTGPNSRVEDLVIGDPIAIGV